MEIADPWVMNQAIMTAMRQVMIEQDQLTVEDIKEVVKEALIEFAEETEYEGMDIPTLNLPCKYCRLPVKAGQLFLVYHSECHEKEQTLR